MMKITALLLAATLLAGCETDNDPGSLLRTTCRSGALALNVATATKPSLSVTVQDTVNRFIRVVDPVCSPEVQPPPNVATQQLVAGALAEVLAVIFVPEATNAAGAVAWPAAMWRAARDAWNAA